MMETDLSNNLDRTVIMVRYKWKSADLEHKSVFFNKTMDNPLMLQRQAHAEKIVVFRHDFAVIAFKHEHGIKQDHGIARNALTVWRT